MSFEQPPNYGELTSDLYAVVRIEERTASDALVRSLGETAPSLFYSQGTTGPRALTIDVPVPHGEGRVIWVELSEGSLDDAQVAYVGRSARFSLQAGESKGVVAVLKLTETPEVSAPEGPFAFEVVDEIEGRVRSSQIRLRLLAPASATSLRVSNLAGLPQGDATEQFELNGANDLDIVPGPDGARSVSLSWDLDQGIDTPCGISDFCQRQINVELRTAEGYAGPVEARQIIVDTQPPAADAATVDSRIFPPAGSFLDDVSALGAGAEYLVSMSFSEPVEAAPTVVAAPSQGGEGLTLTPISTATTGFGTTFSWRLALTALDAAEGGYALEVTAVDRAGNEGVSTLAVDVAQFRVDLRAPDSADVGRLRYLRAPWGTLQDGGARFEVTAEEGAVEPQSEVLFFTSPDVAGRPPIARTVADSQGGFAAVNLGLNEQEVVYALVLDSAGNASDAAPDIEGIQARAIEQARWTATYQNKVSEQIASNPHEVYSMATSVPARRPSASLRGTLTTADITQLNAIDGRGISASSARRWRRILPPGWTQRGSSQFGISKASGRGVLLGGLDGRDQSFFRDQWFWDESRWLSAVRNLVVPPPRINGTLNFFPPTGELLLFGGCTGLACGSPFNETWAWDGTRWFEKADLTGRPRPRSSHNIVYDSRRRRLLLFGGTINADLGRLGDLWSFDGVRWTRLQPGGVDPGPRSSGVMAYDEARDEVIFWGGLGDPSDTLIFDGDDWRVGATAAQSPPFREFAAMAYDPIRDQTIMFGGLVGASELGSGIPRTSETWVWDGGSRRWTRFAPQPGGPLPRYNNQMVFDPSLGQVIMLGGCTIGENGQFGLSCASGVTDVWAWDGSQWRRYADAGFEPAPIGGHAMAFHSATGFAISFGGCRVINRSSGVDCTQYDGSTLAFDGARWLFAGTGGPSPRAVHVMANHSARGELVMFGGALNASGTLTELSDTWVYRNFTWEPRLVPGPGARIAAAMAEDAARQRVLLYGGNNSGLGVLGDLWQWDGTQWTEIVPTGSRPPPRAFPSMAVDPVRNKLVLFGGFATMFGLLPFTPVPVLWEFDLTTQRWSRIDPPTGAPQPLPRGLSAMVWDPTLQEVVLIGGTVGIATAFQDAWSWNGTRWAQLEFTGTQPGGIVYGQAVFDSVREEIIRFGGLVSAGLDGETWVLDGDAVRRPELRTSFDLADASLSREELAGARLQVVAGGTVPIASSPPTDGFEVEAWDASLGRFVVIGTAPSAAGGAEQVQLTLTADEVRRAFTGDGRLDFRIRPLADEQEIGAPATVFVDAVQIEVDYVRPQPQCGNGRVETYAGETCDDGNTRDGDVCTASCLNAPLTHERESNDDTTSAENVGTLGTDWTLVAGDIFPPADVDYWSFAVPEGARVEAQVLFDLEDPDAVCSAAHDSRLAVRDDRNQVVIESTENGPSRCPRIITAPLTEGRKYFVLQHIDGSMSVEPYYLRARLIAP